MDEKRNTIVDFLSEHKDTNPISFHMPGHKGREKLMRNCGFGKFLDNMVGNDITEILGADNLTCPRSSLMEVANRYKRQYGCIATELLVNGSSAGLMASILTAVQRGSKLILGRNSHHSAYSAMRLGGISPVYLRPEINKKYNLLGKMLVSEVQEAIDENPDAAAVLITSPNYYGLLSDIYSISKVCHDAGMVLIVDQAHGAHLKYFDENEHFKRAAENCGADLVVNSTHKTLFSFTGSGILNVCSYDIDLDFLRENLRMLQTTSPSYLLLGSLDMNSQIMERHGKEIVQHWSDDVKYFYKQAERIDGLTVIRDFALDTTKINISMADLGMSGDMLERELRTKNIWAEMAHGEFVMLMTGAGNLRSDYEYLLKVLRDLSSSFGIGRKTKRTIQSLPDFNPAINEIPLQEEKVPLYASEGRVVYSPLICYPPGSPIICPGEIMDMEVISYIQKTLANGSDIIGVDDEGEISVGVESM